jgi:hypothetical protein
MVNHSLNIVDSFKKANSPQYGMTVEILAAFFLWIYKSLFGGLGGDPYSITLIIIRLINIGLGLLSVWLAYLLGKRWGGESAGIASAALLALAVQHVIHSAIALPDVSLGFFIILTYWLLFSLKLSPQAWKKVLPLGICSGLMLGTKIYGLIIVIMCIIYLYREAHHQLFKGWQAIGLSLSYILLTGTIFSLVNPMVFQFSRYIEYTRSLQANYYALYALPLSFAIVPYWWQLSLIGYGPIILFLSGLGLFKSAGATIEAFREKLFIIGSIILFYFSCNWFLNSYYLTSFLPVLCSIAGNAFILLQKRNKRFGQLFFLGLLLIQLFYCFYGITRTYHDPRIQASNYIHKNLLAQDTIGFLSVYPVADRAETDLPSIDAESGRYEPDLAKQPTYIVTSDKQLNLFKCVMNLKDLGPNNYWPESKQFPLALNVPWKKEHAALLAKKLFFYKEVFSRDYAIFKTFELRTPGYIHYYARSGYTIILYKKK